MCYGSSPELSPTFNPIKKPTKFVIHTKINLNKNIDKMAGAAANPNKVNNCVAEVS